MIPLLAQTPPPTAVASWLEVLFYLVGGVTAMVLLVKQFTGKSEQVHLSPTPLEVKAHETAVTRDELAKVDTALHGRLKRERGEIDAQIRRVEEVAERRADKVETKIDENTKLTERLSGQLGQINQNVSQLTSAVTHFLRDSANR